MDDIKLMPEKYNQDKKDKNNPIDFSKKKLGKIGNSFVFLIANWSKFLFIVFILLVLLTLGLWGYRLSLNEKKEQLTQKIESLQSQRHLSLEEDFKKIKKGISNFSELLNNRIYSTKIFEMLEDLTLPNIYFLNFGADLNEGKISLDAQAQNYTVLAKQILVFEQDKRINSVEVSSAGIGQNGQVSSNIIINFNPSLLKQ